MKAVYILLLICGLAAAKPYDVLDDIEEDGKLAKVMEEIRENDQNQSRPTPYYNTPTWGPRPSGGPQPTDKPFNFFGRFIRFLMKTVDGVKPDEHPDRKYMKPGQELVDSLLEVRKAVIKTLKPLEKIGKLLAKDTQDMMIRVHRAVARNDIDKAQHVVGEYFIAIQRRFAMLGIEAAKKGLFDDIEGKSVDHIVKRGHEHMQHLDAASKWILKNFNQFRVSDGLMDEPFIRLSLKTLKEMEEYYKQMEKVAMTSMHVYMDLISRMVHLSIDKNDHDAAVHAAGASVLSFVRRSTKVKIALVRIYMKKMCFD